ncbi:NucA/NucB deoxyribonuclease domain-containing protein [Streptomyces sp. BR1]|uniref:NucA/NucB deoxyribonuclease domain-containing protein n=1 Tax=Streptomyces sp. BR1 TaxID=1592323 RepID=UPI00402B5304
MKLIKFGGILLAALLAASTASATAADAAPPRPKGSITLTTTPNRTSAAKPGAAALTCSPAYNTFDRTSSCSSGGITVNFYLEPEHQYQGSAQLAYTSSVQLDPRNRYKWTNQVSLHLVESTIPAGDLGVGTVTEDCKACTATPGGTQILSPGAVRTYTMTLNSPGTATVTDAQAPLLTYTAPGYSTAQGDLGGKQNVRCDNTPRMSPVQTGGCVHPDYTPTYFLSTTGPYDQVAWHVAWAQQNLKNHWGWQGHGPALTRTTDRALIRTNRRTACPSNIPRPAGKSCDEYPFASTHQGASVNPDFSCHMINARQNTQEGSFRKSWYNSNRLFDGDKFWVDILLPSAHTQVMRPNVQCP